MEDTRIAYIIAEHETPQLAEDAAVSISRQRPNSPVVIMPSEGRGYSETLNAGLAVLEHPPEFLCFLNADVVMIEPDEQVLWRFLFHETVGIIGPRQLDANDRIAHGGIVPHEDGTDWDLDLRHRCWLWPLRDGDERGGDRLTRIDLDVPMVPGSIFYIRRDLLADLGGWPEWTRFYYEDAWLCYLARHRDWRVMFTGACTWRHFGQGSPVSQRYRQAAMTVAREEFVRRCRAEQIPVREWPDEDPNAMARETGALP